MRRKGSETISVRFREDRTRLCSMFIREKKGRSKQVCQVRVDVVGSDAIAFSIMKKVATSYVEGKVHVGELLSLRDEEVKLLGPAQIRKKPSRKIDTASTTAEAEVLEPVRLAQKVLAPAPETPKAKRRIPERIVQMPGASMIDELWGPA